MSNWRDSIVKDFIPQLNRLTIVSDPDGLLLELRLDHEIRNQGFEIIEFDDPVEFRFIYESKYRAYWDDGGEAELIISIRTPNKDFNCIPYDLYCTSRHLEYCLKDIFPKLSYPVLKQLDTLFFDDLFKAQLSIKKDRLSDNETKDFLLKYIFSLNPETVRYDYELLHLLLHLHYNSSPIPLIVRLRLAQILESKNEFKEWPIKDLVLDNSFFFSFLQERWSIFLRSISTELSSKEPPTSYAFKFPGPHLIPFNHDTIRVFIDNLFLEGYLNPVDFPGINVNESSWFRFGIKNDNADVIITKYDYLKDQLLKIEIKNDWHYQDWVYFSLKLSELQSISINLNLHDADFISKIVNESDILFEQWLLSYYSSLSNLSTGDPVMVHHIVKKILRNFEETNKPQALIVCDGLSLNQWFTVKSVLFEQLSQMDYSESSLFSWIPTLTSISRQAIFSGKIPMLFPNSIGNTQFEEKQWRQIWLNHGIGNNSIVFKKGIGTESPKAWIENNIIDGSTISVGIVINVVDQIMHGMQLGSAGMHNQIKQWTDLGFLSELIINLSKKGFKIWLTSDHGNKECIGKVPLKEGALSISKGERVRVYPNETLRSRYANQIDFGLKWPGYGLPNDFLTLLARNNFAFTNPGSISVSHGGISLEEVMVPFIEFN
jgi:hypothetical protein